MAKKIQARTNFRPRLESMSPMEQDELIERIVAAANQSRGILPTDGVRPQFRARRAPANAASVTNHRQERRFRGM